MKAKRDISLHFVHTSDVHGSVFCYDFLQQRQTRGGLSAIYTYIGSLRREYPGHVICTDAGDALQGQPVTYYYNYIDTDSPHVVTEMMNEIRYDAGTVGNHDIETGHAVYDRWIREVNYPMLGANIIDESTGMPYLKPYTIVERDGVRIAILGMITAAIPSWLPRILWSGLYFQDLVECARYWVDVIRKRENPHLIVGLFHSGLKGGIVTDEYVENATERVAREVPGFDLILYGHDHMYATSEVQNVDGNTVKLVGPTSQGARVARVDVHLVMEGDQILQKDIICSTPLIASSDVPSTILLEEQFSEQRKLVSDWLNEPIGTLATTLHERDCYFGDSAYMDFVHQMQLDLTGADVSFAAPLSYDSRLEAGTLTIRDMYHLYRYENFLYTMRLTGQEIKDFLEMSYARWSSQMQSPDDHIMLLDSVMDNGRRKGFVNFAFNFVSSAGIYYTVDVTKPQGQKINIISLADGTPFSMIREYRVAVNSYHGNGGGELLTRGAGIPHSELSNRVLQSTQKDIRYYFIKRVQELCHVNPKCLHQWRFLPDEWAIPALERDRKLLFPDEKPQ